MNQNILRYISIVGDNVINITVKDLKALEDSSNAFRKTNNFKLYKDDNVNTLNECLDLKLPQEVLNVVNTKSEVPYTLYLIMYIIKRIVSTNRPPIKLKSLSLEEYNSLKNYLTSLHQ